MRQAARPHRGGGDAVLAQLLEQGGAVGAGERIVGRRHHANVGREHQQSHLLAENAFDDIEPRQHGGRRIVGLARGEIAVAQHRDFDLAGDLALQSVSCRSATSAWYWSSAVCLAVATASRAQRAEILWQQVARIGEAVHHGLIRRGGERRGQKRRDALVVGDRIEVMAIPDGAFDARPEFGETYPGSRLSFERCRATGDSVEVQLALRRSFVSTRSLSLSAREKRRP